MTVITVLLFNLVMPAFASITSADNKILICSQNGFEWVTVNQQELQYRQLAEQLNLDVDSLFDENNGASPQPPHGKCALCFFEQSDLASHSSDVVIAFAKFQNLVVDLNSKHVVVTLSKYQRPENKAPPIFI